MDSMMDVVVERPIMNNEEDAGGVSDSGSSVVVHSDTNPESGGVNSQASNDGENNNNNNNKVLVSEESKSSVGEKSERKSRKKKERRKKDKKSGGGSSGGNGGGSNSGTSTGEKEKEKKSKTEAIKLLEEENAQLKNDLNDLQLRLVYLEARDHNKELKLIHLQKELEETRSILIEKEGDCVEWEQIDREKDRTVLSLNQTIAILQRDLTVLLDDKEHSPGTPKKTPYKKQSNRLVFSPKPEEVFEYPREEDYDSDAMTSDEYDEEDEEAAEEIIKEDDEQEPEEDGEVVTKDIDESEQSNPVFFPFPSLSALPPSTLSPTASTGSPQIENPLVKIFSPTMTPPYPDFVGDSPVLSHQSSPSPIPESPEVKSHQPHQPQSHQPHPPSTPPPHKANGAPPPHPNGSSHSISPSNSSSNLSIKAEFQHSPSQISPTSPRVSTSPTSSLSPRDTPGIPTSVSVKELRTMWENTSSARLKENK